MDSSPSPRTNTKAVQDTYIFLLTAPLVEK